ncbi:unnamed protein product [Bursaphelenchus okinawaensis]|uniref:Dynamin-like GTPase OPA1, mitochondrial n=1 Tax=Bursaphelenchus okinawaensis TaxID=465554 RepID=A0A811K6D6_9BILA|nr:unnamed protein product [Bursaphelenchus okinawaensis]CAG9092449.1 unnamed protein product [Bursaphelenchus okinawaensis]
MQKDTENDGILASRSYRLIPIRSFYAARPSRLLQPVNRITGRRFFVTVLLRHALKLRYWVATGLIGGGITAGNWYEEWKKSLPDFSLPEWAKFEEGTFRSFSDDLRQLGERFENIDFKGKLPSLPHFEMKQKSVGDTQTSGTENSGDGGSSGGAESSTFFSMFSRKSEDKEKHHDQTPEERIQALQEEILKTQMQYQRELESLEKENKTLKQRLLLKDKGELKRLKKLKRSLIDMYSEMLDILNEYDRSYSTTDNLPRVVVVGDQSAGKTSVLEMIAQARIFPRGSGEMMTRAPVKVTLSEGPYHVAQFRDSNREFDLTKEDDLEKLRNEIELRMRNSVKGGKTVSNDVISLTVKGPNLPRIVLVDLPGVISTVTADMARETKDDIIHMCRQHMENPNSIILCIQDGSVDAERSNVTDIVSRIDPAGQRTILVLTKVDLAEKNLNNPDRIRKILEGKLFPMKAIGYFGVVTGMDRKDATIEEIRRYEEQFFEGSSLFKEGVLKPSQMTTRNMSLAVSDCFWRMVRDTIDAQCDAFRAARFNLETEWKNTFPRIRELDRDELFDKARGEILDQIVNLSLVSADEWESLIKKKLLESISKQIFDQILLPTSGMSNAGAFNTAVDIRLKHWTEKELSNLSVKVGWESLAEVFRTQVLGEGHNQGRQEHDAIFDDLKGAVIDQILKEHQWDMKAVDYLKVIQLNAISDPNIPDRKTWESACRFMGEAVDQYLEKTKKTLSEARGPGFYDRWVKWKNPSYDNIVSENLQKEFRQILHQNVDQLPALNEEDVTVVRRNLEAKELKDVSKNVMLKEWQYVFREFYLERLKQASQECMGYYQHYKQGLEQEGDLDCQAVALFYRIKKMLDLSSNALRQQVTNTEQRRVEKEVKDLLDDWSQDQNAKTTYLTGKRVELAENLKRVRYIQEKLEEFMHRLHQEKK